MIGKIMQNNSFQATTDYVLKKEQSRLVGGTMFSDQAEALAREFLMTRDRNLEVKKPVYHLTQSYAYQDTATKNLDDERLAEMATRHFAGLVVASRNYQLLLQEDKTAYHQKVDAFIEEDLHNYQFFIAVHADRQHQHTHLVASRISAWDGSVIATWKDRSHSQMVCRDIEREFELQQLQNSWEVGRRSLSRRQYEKQAQTGKPAIQTQLQEAIDQVAKSHRGISFEQFIERLETQGIEARITQQGKQTGISYAMNGVAMRGSKLGRNFTISGLQRNYGIGIDRPTDPTSPPQPLQSDRLQAEQTEYAMRLAPILADLWVRERANRPKLKTITFERYQIKADGDQPPELFKRDQPLLRWTEAGYQGEGLTLQDCEAIEKFNQASIVQAAGRDRSRAETDAQTQEKQQQWRYYRDRYNHFATQRTDINLTLKERDLLVGWRALEDGDDAETMAAMIAAGSRQGQLIRQQQGQDAGLKYIEQVKAELMAEREKQIKTRLSGIDR